MDTQRDDTKIVSVPKKALLPFVKLSEIDQAYFNKLQEMKVRLVHRITKNKKHFFLIEIKLHDLLPLELPIKQARFNALRALLELPLVDNRGRDRLEYVVSARVRFVKGSHDHGDYKSMELIFKQYLYHIYWFQDADELRLLEFLENSKKLELSWITRPDKVDQAEMVNYKFED